MSVSPTDIVNLASGLLLSDGASVITEAALRCSTSRAYYAVLHAADEALPDDLALTAADRKGRGSHQAVIDATVLWSKAVRPGRSDAITVARNLAKLRSARKRADYNVEDNFTVEDAIEALRVAKITVECAARALSAAVGHQQPV